ncbi:MAG TPA: alpha/beta fold hydrolase [Candidatus Dormibacteraeota bacterium]|nr:alpha/beta fold hydrolase [Candidatus Dormibacteraeota bacterium]
MFTGAQYARSGNVNIAYQVVGDGPVDLVLVLGWVSHLAYVWELPAMAAFLTRLASFSRLILFDKRGCGMSDRVHPLPTLEQRMDDVRAVMDAAGSEKAALLGISEGGVMSALFAATYPERAVGLIIDGSYASGLRRPGYPWGATEDELEEAIASRRETWGKSGGRYIDRYAPTQVDNPEVEHWWAIFTQMAASPGDAVDLLRMNGLIDIRDVLPAIRVPTLIIHAAGDRVAPIEAGRYLAQHIPGAKLLELDSIDHWPYFGDADLVLGEIQEFLTGARTVKSPETMLATVLCTNVTQAGAHAVWLGDKKWNQLVEHHHSVVRKELARYSGREIEAGPSGVTAVFDGTARAIRCALDIRDQLLELGLRIRAGLHAGECEMGGGRPRGVALNVASGVMNAAKPGEVLVSGTIKDLVVGSGLEFADRGIREFAGVPGQWALFAAGSEPPAATTPRVPPAVALSRREREVARLLADGLSNRDIARRLYLSERTVDNHVHHILDKLGFDSRVQVATWLARNEHLN